MTHQPDDLNKQPAGQRKWSKQTHLVTAARGYGEHGIVNPAVYHASTILFPDVESFRARDQEYVYGRRGTPTLRALEEAIATVEGGHTTRLAPSGLSAIATTMFALLKTGDHILITDSAYQPTRALADGILARMGIETTYYDPLVGAGIAELIRPNTRMLFLESPGSHTMDVQDVPAMTEIARKRGLLSVIDNTWSAGHCFNAFEAGCDVSIQAATKYYVGHSDAMLGSITVNAALSDEFLNRYGELGQCAGPDDVYLGLRGIRTLDVRLERHMKNALTVAEWLKGRAEVAEVLYPALPGAPGHDLWRRDFTGACGLFSIVFHPVSSQAFAACVDNLELFGIGASWGGYESLCLPFNPAKYRTATTWTRPGPALRLHIGLEHPDDLIADLEAGLGRMTAN